MSFSSSGGSEDEGGGFLGVVEGEVEGMVDNGEGGGGSEGVVIEGCDVLEVKKLIRLFWPAVVMAFDFGVTDGVSFVFCLFAGTPEELEDDFAGEFVGEAALIEGRLIPDDAASNDWELERVSDGGVDFLVFILENISLMLWRCLNSENSFRQSGGCEGRGIEDCRSPLR